VEEGLRGPRPRRAAGDLVVRVTVDRDLCIGAGMCVLTAPAVFDQDPDEAVVVLLDEQPPESERPAVEQAVGRCPAAVIRLLP
jgi:ferredoxin